MTTLVQNLSDFLKVLIQAFNFSSTFPALVFVILSRLYLLPSLPESSSLRVDIRWDDGTLTIVSILLVALIAYFLDAANLAIIRFFEGYWFKNQFPFDECRKRHQEFVRRTQKRVRNLESVVDALIVQATQQQKEELLDLAREIVAHKRDIISQVADKYPDDPAYILPSPFGNVIAAAEQYPRKVLGMDTVALWPFLVPTLTRKNYAQFILREQAVMSFLVNTTVILALFGFLLGITEWLLYGWSWVLAGKLALVAVCCAVTFLLSIQGAAGWGATMRTAFVLFREDLRSELHLRRPSDYEDERLLWEMASNFLRAQSSLEKQVKWGRAIFNASSYGQSTAGKKEEGS